MLTSKESFDLCTAAGFDVSRLDADDIAFLGKCVLSDWRVYELAGIAVNGGHAERCATVPEALAVLKTAPPELKTWLSDVWNVALFYAEGE